MDVQQKKKKVIFLTCSDFFGRKFTLFCPPTHDFSEWLKTWNFDKNSKVSSRWVDVQQKRKKIGLQRFFKRKIGVGDMKFWSKQKSFVFDVKM